MIRYLPAFLAAICFGFAPNLIRMALAEGFSPVAGSFIATSAALPIYTIAVISQQRRVFVEGFNWRYSAFAIGAGLLTSSASLFLYLALSRLQVSVVVAINSSALVFNLILAWGLLRERVTWRILLGTAFIVAGIFLVVF